MQWRWDNIYITILIFFSADDDEITFDPDDIITDIEQVIAILLD